MKTAYPLQWDFSSLSSGLDDPRFIAVRETTEKAARAFSEKWQKDLRWLEEAPVLLAALKEYEELLTTHNPETNEIYYLFLRSEVETDNPKVKAVLNGAIDWEHTISDLMRFFDLRLARIPKEKQAEFLKDPTLSYFRHHLESLFSQSQWLLSEEAEKVVSYMSQTSYRNWEKMVDELLSKEERGGKSYSMLYAGLNDKEKKVRDENATHMHAIFASHVEVAVHELNSILGHKHKQDLLRGVERPDVPRHVVDDIETEIVDAMLATVESGYGIAHRLYKLKAQLFGVEKLAYHERNLEYGKLEKKFTYDQAVDVVKETFGDLDPEFEATFLALAQNGNIDVEPKKGKTSGAFCASGAPNHESYILLNFMGKANDVMTLAHESGHAMHNHFIKKTQKAIYQDSPVSIAEVASTFMEDFVAERLMSETSKEEQLALLLSRLDEDVSTIIRQVAAYRFEQALHKDFREKKFLSKDDIGKLFQEHMRAYMGEYVEQSAGAENWWVGWPHIRNYFYVYSYASGLLISKSMQAMVRKNGQDIEKVKQFLSTGTSKSVVQTFREIGIDVTRKDFWEMGMGEIEERMNEAEKLARDL